MHQFVSGCFSVRPRNWHRLVLLNVKSATRPNRDKQANIRDTYDVAKHTNIKSMLSVKSALTTVHML